MYICSLIDLPEQFDDQIENMSDVFLFVLFFALNILHFNTAFV